MKEIPWAKKHFDDRQIKEMEFCAMYAAEFSHGTDGHNVKIIVSKLVSLLTCIHFELVGRNYPENINPVMGYDLEEKEESD